MPTTTARWSPPGSIGSDLAGTTFNSLGSGSTSGRITHDNRTARDVWVNVRLILGSFTPLAPFTVLLNNMASQDGNAPDDVSALGGNGVDQYSYTITSGAGVKILVFKRVLLYPENNYFTVTNNAGAAFAASGHSFFLRTYNEEGSS